VLQAEAKRSERTGESDPCLPAECVCRVRGSAVRAGKTILELELDRVAGTDRLASLQPVLRTDLASRIHSDRCMSPGIRYLDACVDDPIQGDGRLAAGVGGDHQRHATKD